MKRLVCRKTLYLNRRKSNELDYKKAMHKFFILLFSLLATMAQAQKTLGIYDNRIDIEWAGDTAHFTTSDEGYLVLNSQDYNSPKIISTLSVPTDSVTVWEATVWFDYSTSSSNMVSICILCDTVDQCAAGLQVDIGTTNDNVRMLQDGTAVITGEAKTITGSSDYTVSIRVERYENDDAQYHYSLYSDATGEMTLEGECDIDYSWHTGMDYMAAIFKFSKTKAAETYALREFNVTGGMSPSARATGEDLLKQTYRGCVVINELMTDPDDALGVLPADEYIEILNVTDSVVQLSGWTIENLSTVGTLDSYRLQPGEYLVLCQKSKLSDFDGIVDNIMAPSSWPTLTNSGNTIVLRDPQGVVIDAVAYTEDYLGDTFKNAGGWSIERIDTTNLSMRQSNWAVCEDDAGGTPGTVNSVAADNPDNDTPTVSNVVVSDDGTYMTLSYDEPIDTLNLPNTLKINGVSTDASFVCGDEVSMSTLIITLSETLAASTVYEIRMPTVYDLAGNVSDDETIEIGIPETPVAGDVIINEVMWTASPVAGDYVEIVTLTKIVDLSKLYVGKMEDEVLTTIAQISSVSRLMTPGQYIVSCRDSLTALETYSPANPKWLVDTNDFPSYDDEGTVVITDAAGTIIDRLDYSASMHNPLVKDEKNIALERIYTSGASSTTSNWTSASAESNYATPTEINSQNRDNAAEMADGLTITNKVFTPDGDGVDDKVTMTLTMSDGVWNATVRIYTSRGVLVATPYNNTILPASGELYWTGVSDDGGRLSPGTYIIHIRAWQLGGETKEYKKTCVIAETRR